MNELNLSSAQILRILSSFFGSDNIIVNYSANAIFKELNIKTSKTEQDLKLKCPFVILNNNDEIVLIIDLSFNLESDDIDLKILDRNQILSSKFNDKLKYICLTKEEFSLLLDTQGGGVFHFLKNHYRDKLEEFSE